MPNLSKTLELRKMSADSKPMPLLLSKHLADLDSAMALCIANGAEIGLVLPTKKTDNSYATEFYYGVTKNAMRRQTITTVMTVNNQAQTIVKTEPLDKV